MEEIIEEVVKKITKLKVGREFTIGQFLSKKIDLKTRTEVSQIILKRLLELHLVETICGGDYYADELPCLRTNYEN